MSTHSVLISTLALAMLPLPAIAQTPWIPKGPPTAFETRNTGDTFEQEADLNRRKKASKRAKPKTVTYTAVTDLRIWKGANGSILSAQLLAFAHTTPSPGTLMPLIRDGKVRLFVHGAKRVSEISIDTLSTADQHFIQDLDAARQAATNPPAGE